MASSVSHRRGRRQPLAPGLESSKSTLGAATHIPGKDKKMIFASGWVFKPEGVRAVKAKFDEALAENNLVRLELPYLDSIVERLDWHATTCSSAD